MLDYIKQSLELVVTILVLLSTIIGLIAGLTKSEKAKKAAFALNFYKNKAEHFIVVAEAMKGMSGEEKKAFVIKNVKALAEVEGIDVDEDLLGIIIDNIVSITKKVNVK